MDRLVFPEINCRIFDQSTDVTAIRIYNRIPIDIKKLDDNKFKIYLKKWLINNVFYDLKEFYDKTRYCKLV